MNRKLIRPDLTEIKEQLQAPPKLYRQRKPIPPEQTNAESFYYLKQMTNKTRMVIHLRDGEQIRGVIEWYDRHALKVHRAGEVDLSSGRIYHVLSPFELDEPLARVWPPSGAGNPMRLVVTLYDLIPVVFASQYLADPGQRRRYRARLELVRAADRVLAISAASRDEAIARLGLDAARVTTIGAGISPAFRPPASKIDSARRCTSRTARRARPGAGSL